MQPLCGHLLLRYSVHGRALLTPPTACEGCACSARLCAYKWQALRGARPCATLCNMASCGCSEAFHSRQAWSKPARPCMPVSTALRHSTRPEPCCARRRGSLGDRDTGDPPAMLAMWQGQIASSYLMVHPPWYLHTGSSGSPGYQPWHLCPDTPSAAFEASEAIAA